MLSHHGICLLAAISKLLKAVLILITSLTLLGNLGVDITAILGSVSVLGLAFGLAAQDSVANLFGAVAVFVDKPFKVGDRINDHHLTLAEKRATRAKLGKV